MCIMQTGPRGIFYHRDDVFTVSLHADPVRFYPFFWGHRHERGEAAGAGYNLNCPLEQGTSDEDYLQTLEEALSRIDSFCPEAMVVALGLDAFQGDPLAGLSITTEGFQKIGRAIAALKLPSVLVQEVGLPLQGTRRKPDCFYRRVRKKLKEIIFLINILKKSKILIENKYLIIIKTIHFYFTI